MSQTQIPLRIRRPVIPGVNDSLEEIKALGDFIQDKDGVKRIDLLPYHALSADKYRRLDREENVDWETPSQEDQNRITEQLEGMGFDVKWGG